MKSFALIFPRFCQKKRKILKTHLVGCSHSNKQIATKINRILPLFSLKTIFRVLAIFLIKTYKVFFSLYFGGACRFYPSCSSYADEAFSSYPPSRALFFVLKRLLKCHFFGPYGLDKLPCSPKGKKTAIK